MPQTWSSLAVCDPAAFTLRTVPALLRAEGDPHADIDTSPCAIDGLLSLADAQEPAQKQKKKAPREKLPLLVIAHAKTKPEALAGLERWKARFPQVFARLSPEHVIVDAMRGRSSAWYRIRLNMKDVPVEERPAQEAPDPNYDPLSEWTEVDGA
jgi:hypothetical protein